MPAGCSRLAAFCQNLNREIGGLRAYARHREAGSLPGQTLQAVREAIASKRIIRGADGKIDFQMADMMWLANTDKIQQQRAYQGMPPQGREAKDAEPNNDAEIAKDWAKWRARTEKAKAELAELDLDERRGELVEMTSVISAIEDCNIKARNAMLQIPDRIAGQLAAESDPLKIYSMLLAEIENVSKAIEAGVLQLVEMAEAA